MNRKTFSTLLLVAIFAIIAITGSAYTYYFQANDIEDNEKQLKDLKVNAQNTEELEIQLADLKLKIQEMDSILSLRKYVIPTKITQSSFFQFVNDVSANFSENSQWCIFYIPRTSPEGTTFFPHCAV